ncbi:NAD-dependent 4,6-dehydratase LegB [Alphaproteobacteria bacterium]|nr:NAD-dependent 4,6-dehydratase LegB [Alphaproteobacteria bacterium]
MPKYIFVTGSEGFIGSHLTESLIRNGHKVKALVQYNSFNNIGWLADLPYDFQNEIEIVMGDIRDATQMRNEIKSVDEVMHLAALIAIPYSYVAPQSYIDTNISGTLNVLQACRDFDVPVIHTSTSEVYGTAKYVPIDEAHPLQGQSPYSASKIGADQIAYSYFTSFQTPIKIIRPFNTYGPRQSMRAVIPTIITQIINGNPRIKLGSLTPTRDFNFISDTVEGFLKAMNSNNGFGSVINIGSGFEISIGDMVRLIAEEMKEEIDIITEEQRLRPSRSEVERLLACNKKAQALLGWTPRYGNLEGLRKGISETIKWFSEDQNIAKYKVSKYVI